MDKGYDYSPVHEACMARGTLPIMARRRNPGETERPKPHACEHGDWTLAGADFKRKRTKWRCPSGECQPRHLDQGGSPEPARSPLHEAVRRLYRGRGAVEREFGRLKHDYGLAPLRVRGLGRVQLHADLTMLARLSQALARARAVPLAA